MSLVLYEWLSCGLNSEFVSVVSTHASNSRMIETHPCSSHQQKCVTMVHSYSSISRWFSRRTLKNKKSNFWEGFWKTLLIHVVMDPSNCTHALNSPLMCFDHDISYVHQLKDLRLQNITFAIKKLKHLCYLVAWIGLDID